MNNRQSILRFLGRFFLFFILLMAPWPALHDIYGSMFRTGCNVVLSRFGPHGEVRWSPLMVSDNQHDTELVLIDRQTRRARRVAGDSRLYGYLPTAYILCLILATPMPTRRRPWAIAGGLALVHLYVLFRLLVFLGVAFTGRFGPELYTLGPVSGKILDFVHWVVVVSFAGWLIVPLPIWLVVSFRRADWAKLFHSTGTSTPGDTEHHLLTE